MTKHTTAFVPVEAWTYASPDVRLTGSTTDIGLLCESLIYYDHVLAFFGGRTQLYEFLKWLNVSNELPQFIQLVEEGVIQLVDLAFLSSAVESNGVFGIVNIQDPIMQRPNSFDERVLYHPDLHIALPNKRDRMKVFAALRGKTKEFKADEFGPAVENARADLMDARRSEIIIQAFVDDLYEAKSLGRPPQVKATIVPNPRNDLTTTNYTIDFGKLSAVAGPALNFSRSSPINAAANSAKLLWAAALNSSDLFAPSPISKLIGDKLYESVGTPVKIEQVMSMLKAEVEFPDVRRLINSRQLKLADVLSLRAGAKQFRTWLQEEGERDRNAIIAYHHEVAQASGISKAGRKFLSLFGIFGGPVIGGAIGSTMSGAEGAIVGAVAGSGVSYVADLAAKFGSGWSPVVFGKWAEDRIKKLLNRA